MISNVKLANLKKACRGRPFTMYERWAIDNPDGGFTGSSYKAAIIGSTKSGKTCFRMCLMGQSMPQEYHTTAGFDIREAQIADIYLGLWELTDKEYDKNKSYIKYCCLYFVVFDMTDRFSFEQVPVWIERCNEAADTKWPNHKVLVAMKRDLADCRKVSADEAEALALQHDMFYMEFSAASDVKATIDAKIMEVLTKLDAEVAHIDQ